MSKQNSDQYQYDGFFGPEVDQETGVQLDDIQIQKQRSENNMVQGDLIEDQKVDQKTFVMVNDQRELLLSQDSEDEQKNDPKVVSQNDHGLVGFIYGPPQ